jgi:hypothetical protein
MKTQTWTWTPVIVAITLLAGIAYGAAPSRPNWAQVDFQDGWLCVGPTSGFSEFFEVPGSSLALTTLGNPVLVSLTVNMQQRPDFQISGAGFQTVLVIDGQVQDPLLWQLRLGGAEEAAVISSSRIHLFPAGAHTFRLHMSCKNPWELLNGWLNVYELAPLPAKAK